MKYYKILNEYEKHNGLQYKTGLIVDPVSFNPSGDCLPGGIYFSREDILAFLDYGPWLREVILPDDAKVYQNPGVPIKWKADRVILGERVQIDLQVIKDLVEEGADIHVDSDYALRWAGYKGNLDIVKFLVESGADVHARLDEALILASKYGRLDIVKFLVESGAAVHARLNDALRWAGYKGNLDIVKFLVESGADVHARNDEALGWARENGHSEVVKFLIAAGVQEKAEQ